MIYLDANVLYACVANVAGQTDLAERLLRRKEVFCLSALTDYERGDRGSDKAGLPFAREPSSLVS